MNTTINKPTETTLLKWDELDIIHTAMESIQDNIEDYSDDEEMLEIIHDHEKLFNYCAEDQSLFDTEWEYFQEQFPEVIKETLGNHEFYDLEGTNLDWRGSSGIAEAIPLEKIFSSIRGNVGDFSMRVYKKDNCLYIRFSHHDCPTGSFIEVKPSRWKPCDACSDTLTAIGQEYCEHCENLPF